MAQLDLSAMPIRHRRDPVINLRRLVRAVGLAATLVWLSAPMAQAAEPGAAFLRAVKAVEAPQGFNGVCERMGWVCMRSAGEVRDTRAKLRLADRVNRDVNRRYREVTDARQYRTEEYWALPTAAGGDCEDFALMKKRELMARGVAGERLLIATVLDRQRRQHAVLVLRTDAGDYVLDNLTSRIKHWSETGYSFLRMQDPRAPQSWIAVLAGGMFGNA